MLGKGRSSEEEKGREGGGKGGEEEKEGGGQHDNKSNLCKIFAVNSAFYFFVM